MYMENNERKLSDANNSFDRLIRSAKRGSAVSFFFPPPTKTKCPTLIKFGHDWKKPPRQRSWTSGLIKFANVSNHVG